MGALNEKIRIRNSVVVSFVDIFHVGSLLVDLIFVLMIPIERGLRMIFAILFSLGYCSICSSGVNFWILFIFRELKL